LGTVLCHKSQWIDIMFSNLHPPVAREPFARS
jgi:hypothetical protein